MHSMDEWYLTQTEEPFKPIWFPSHLAQFVILTFQPKNAPPDGNNFVK